MAGMLRPEKKDDCTFFFQVVIWRRLRFGGNVMTAKKCSVVWPAMFFDWTFFFQVVIRGGSDLAGTLRPKKKTRPVIWPAMFFSWFKLQPEKLRMEKKVQSSHLTGRFFQRVQITTRKNYDRKKRYSPLANGGGSYLAGTL